MLDIPRPIQSALGIQTNDILTTSYNSGPYIVHRIHGPFTHFECTNSIVILDHPEISLTLLSPGASKKRASGYINNIRQVGDTWLTAQNDELFMTRPEPVYVEPATLFDIFHPPNTVEILPIQSPYQLDPLVDYESGPRHTWRCEACHTDFNAAPTNKYWCKHNCGSDLVAKEIHYVRAPHPDDRRPYVSYYVMTLNSYRYQPVPAYTSSSSSTTTGRDK